MRGFYLIFFSLIFTSIQSQNFSKKSLIKKSYKELLSLFNEISTDTINAEKVIRIYLDKSQKDRDTLKMARAYARLIAINKSSKRLIFLDSIIYLTKNLQNKQYPAVGYILKGLEYYRIGNLKLATENYIEAYKLALKNENITQQIFISDKLIGLKSYWGNKQEALELQKKRHQLVTKKEYLKEIKLSAIERGSANFENLYFESVLSSMQNFIICHINLKALDSASIYLEKGLQKTTEYKGYNQQYFYNWFTIASIEIDWHSTNYNNVILTSNQLLATIDTDTPIKPELLIDLYFFKGFSLIKLDKGKEGIKYLKKVDSIFEQKEISLLPYHRKLFEELLDYYSLKNNTKMKIKYLNKLLVVDSIFKKNYQFFEPNLIKNYERPQLLEEKETEITDLKQKNKKNSIKTWWMFVFLIVSLIGLGYYFKRQQLFKKRFEKLIQEQESSKEEHKDIKNIEVLPNEEKIVEELQKNKISEEITVNILNHLKKFEINKEYLSQEISLQKMAKHFGTNYNYLSKVINLNKKKNFSTYINDLRIEYSFQALKVNSKLRMYTIKAIANECGFSSSEHFSKKFYEKYGIYPSYYIRKLKKSNI